MKAQKILDGVREKLAAHRLLRHSLTLLSGSVLSQVIMIGLTMLLARLYSPTELGRFGVYSSIVGVVVAVAAWRYDMTVVLPKNDGAARRLVRLSVFIVVGMSVGTSLVCFFATDIITNLFAKPDPGLAKWLWMSGASVASLGLITTFVYWFNRKQEYRPVAANRVLQSSSTALSQIGLAPVFAGGMGGLVIGSVFGQFLAAGTLFYRAKSLRVTSETGAPKIRTLMVRYKKMPLVNGPSALIDAVRTNGIAVLIGTIALDQLGFYLQAVRFIEAPIALINGAISAVFFQRMTELKPGEMGGFIRKAVVRGFLLGLIPFGLILAFAPWFFSQPLFFGTNYDWSQSGNVARALVPWLYLTLITSPISTVFIVAERQGILLAHTVFYTLVPLSILSYSPYDFLTTLWIMSCAMAAVLVIFTGLALYAAYGFDTGRHTKSDTLEEESQTEMTQEA